MCCGDRALALPFFLVCWGMHLSSSHQDCRCCTKFGESSTGGVVVKHSTKTKQVRLETLLAVPAERDCRIFPQNHWRGSTISPAERRREESIYKLDESI